jgi:hypothetical protein
VVAKEVAVQPSSAGWQLEFSSDDGRVFHRNGEPLGPVRSVEWIDTEPEKEFAMAKVSDVNESRNHISLNVDVPAGDENALLIFSRPYFGGYHARIRSQALEVDSYRGLFPMVELPSGSHGQLTLVYRPPWLVAGGILSILCAVICVTSAAIAFVSRSQT